MSFCVIITEYFLEEGVWLTTGRMDVNHGVADKSAVEAIVEANRGEGIEINISWQGDGEAEDGYVDIGAMDIYWYPSTLEQEAYEAYEAGQIH